MCSCPLLPLAIVLAALLTTAAPLPSGHVQLCGHYLADVLALICEGRGYNDPFSTSPGSSQTSPGKTIEPNGRGVVDECCKTGCTYGTLEQYCSASPVQESGSMSRSQETSRPPMGKPRAFLRALVDQRVESLKRDVSTEPPPPFRVGIINSYFDGFILPVANRLRSINLNLSEEITERQ